MPRDVGDDSNQLTACYDVGGFRLRVGADSPELIEPANRLLARFQVDALLPPAWRLTVGRFDPNAEVPRPAELREIWSGVVSPDVRGVNYVGRGLRRLELCQRGWLDLDLNAAQASIALAPQSKPTTAGYFLLPLICEGLRLAGHCPVHAACLAAPVGDDWRSVLIVAKSETGKSTTALALTDSGWKLMGDDIALVCREDGRLKAWGFPRACHVRRNTLRLLPWLNELPLAATSIEGTSDLPLEGLGDRAWLWPPQPLKPGLIICLDRPNAGDHQIQPLDRAAALIHLSEENVQPIEGYSDPAAQQAFVTFAQLVQQVPACRLSAGPRLERLADRLTEFLAR
jgi:hypothetical protein